MTERQETPRPLICSTNMQTTEVGAGFLARSFERYLLADSLCLRPEVSAAV